MVEIYFYLVYNILLLDLKNHIIDDFLKLFKINY
jgi:hypothetical protein